MFHDLPPFLHHHIYSLRAPPFHHHHGRWGHGPWEDHPHFRHARPPFAHLFVHNLFKIFMLWIALSISFRLVTFVFALVMSPLLWTALLITVFSYYGFGQYSHHPFSHKRGPCCRRPFHPPSHRHHPMEPHSEAIDEFADVNKTSETICPISSSISQENRENEEQETKEKSPEKTRITPPYNLDEENEFFTVSIDVPGFRKDDLQITLDEGSTLSVFGKRVDSKNQIVEFKLKFSLDPSKLKLSDNMSDMSADLSLGVLTIKVPKKEKEAARIIPIVDTTKH